MRPSSGVSEEGLSPRLLIQLSEEEIQTIFASSPLNALSEDEEIARRVEEEMYRVRKEKDLRKQLEDERKFREDEMKRAEEAEVTPSSYSRIHTFSLSIRLCMFDYDGMCSHIS